MRIGWAITYESFVFATDPPLLLIESLDPRTARRVGEILGFAWRAAWPFEVPI